MRSLLLLAVCLPLGAQTLQHRPPPILQPESCEDQVSRQRHYLLEAAKVTKDPEQMDAMVNWYLDTANGRRVAWACSEPKLAARMLIRFDIAKLILAEGSK